MARKTLLAVSGLVSVHDRSWTTDRGMAARRWAEVHPELAADLSLLLKWSESVDLPDAGALGRALDVTVAAIVSAFDASIGRWD